MYKKLMRVGALVAGSCAVVLAGADRAQAAPNFFYSSVMTAMAAGNCSFSGKSSYIEGQVLHEDNSYSAEIFCQLNLGSEAVNVNDVDRVRVRFGDRHPTLNASVRLCFNQFDADGWTATCGSTVYTSGSSTTYQTVYAYAPTGTFDANTTAYLEVRLPPLAPQPSVLKGFQVQKLTTFIP